LTDVGRLCPACKGCRPRAAFTRDGVAYVRCGTCATLYQAVEPDWQRIRQIYQADYHKLRGHLGDPALEASKQATASAYLKMLERFRPPGRRLVDVGCSTGAALEAAARGGWAAEGVEVVESAAEIARRRPGVRAVHLRSLEDTPLGDGQVDAFTMFDVIEHVDPPDAMLASVWRRLRPGGLLLIVTPDAGSSSARLMRARWPHAFVEHVVLFSRRGMQIALRAAGFRIERCGFAWKRVNLDMLVRHATLHPHVSFGGVLRLAARVLPPFVLRRMIPFNIGEFYVIARRPERS
jgi:2-polyprenyl-3-methyl-5-hydroxy-6-metoxy-1,4-benzoquinol methylase